jgi:hypothetical protein
MMPAGEIDVKVLHLSLQHVDEAPIASLRLQQILSLFVYPLFQLSTRLGCIELRLDTSEQFLFRERFGQIVIGSQCQSLDSCFGSSLGA